MMIHDDNGHNMNMDYMQPSHRQEMYRQHKMYVK